MATARAGEPLAGRLADGELLSRALFDEPSRSLDRITRLHALSSALSAALSADDVAHAIVTHGMEATGASCGVLGLPERHELLLAHRHRFGAAGSAPPRLPRDADAPMPEAMRTGEP